MGIPSFDDNGDKMPQRMRWTKRCAYCQNEFEANRDDAQTCSPAHRIALHRREKRKRIASAGQTGVEATPPASNVLGLREAVDQVMPDVAEDHDDVALLRLRLGQVRATIAATRARAVAAAEALEDA